jgi:hypothetical protein
MSAKKHKFGRRFRWVPVDFATGHMDLGLARTTRQAAVAVARATKKHTVWTNNGTVGREVVSNLWGYKDPGAVRVRIEVIE